MAAILNFQIFAKNGKTQICFYLYLSYYQQGVLFLVYWYGNCVYKGCDAAVPRCNTVT